MVFKEFVFLADTEMAELPKSLTAADRLLTLDGRTVTVRRQYPGLASF